MPQSCKDIRAALAACLATSPCVLEGNKPGDCLRPPLCHDLPTQCQQLQKGYASCKRGMIDMRKRFRGNKPIGALGEASGQEEGKMLYAGRSMSGTPYASEGLTGSGESSQSGYDKSGR